MAQDSVKDMTLESLPCYGYGSLVYYYSQFYLASICAYIFQGQFPLDFKNLRRGSRCTGSSPAHIPEIAIDPL